jgi:hypothetical protein
MVKLEGRLVFSPIRNSINEAESHLEKILSESGTSTKGRPYRRRPRDGGELSRWEEFMRTRPTSRVFDRCGMERRVLLEWKAKWQLGVLHVMPDFTLADALFRPAELLSETVWGPMQWKTTETPHQSPNGNLTLMFQGTEKYPGQLVVCQYAAPDGRVHLWMFAGDSLRARKHIRLRYPEDCSSPSHLLCGDLYPTLSYLYARARNGEASSWRLLSFDEAEHKLPSRTHRVERQSIDFLVDEPRDTFGSAALSSSLATVHPCNDPKFRATGAGTGTWSFPDEAKPKHDVEIELTDPRSGGHAGRHQVKTAQSDGFANLSTLCGWIRESNDVKRSLARNKYCPGDADWYTFVYWSSLHLPSASPASSKPDQLVECWRIPEAEMLTHGYINASPEAYTTRCVPNAIGLRRPGQVTRRQARTGWTAAFYTSWYSRAPAGRDDDDALALEPRPPPPRPLLGAFAHRFPRAAKSAQ